MGSPEPALAALAERPALADLAWTDTADKEAQPAVTLPDLAALSRSNCSSPHC